MKQYRIKEVYHSTDFGYKITKYIIQRKKWYFFWCDEGSPYDTYLSASAHIDLLRENALFEDDDETI